MRLLHWRSFPPTSRSPVAETTSCFGHRRGTEDLTLLSFLPHPTL
ncbi:hypothetical protein RISK_001606 [Rhodopirellula islandica]|uniref:Uncharacterized protein n=1 Tax=Rhodopirellula islandica TaxID=595434 RepID=A0A0J1BIN3_RHOIS|nr:hypothetical protein RISK_001606 [Rhodopirellula islandica]